MSAGLVALLAVVPVLVVLAWAVGRTQGRALGRLEERVRQQRAAPLPVEEPARSGRPHLGIPEAAAVVDALVGAGFTPTEIHSWFGEPLTELRARTPREAMLDGDAGDVLILARSIGPVREPGLPVSDTPAAPDDGLVDARSSPFRVPRTSATPGEQR